MNRSPISSILLVLLICLGSTHAIAQEPPAPPAAPAEPAAPAAPAEPAEQAQLDVERDDDSDFRSKERRRRHRGHENVIVHVGDDSKLAEGEYADSVIAILGSATTAGEVGEAVVAIGGNATATGPVGDGVVALFGDVFVDNEVGHDVVAVFGNVQLGPNAVINGETVSVGGVITRDPAAVMRGPQQQIAFGENFGRLEWLKSWFEYCFLYGRPLAFESEVAWAWWMAAGFLVLYVLLSLMFDQGMQRCVTTLEERPAQSALAAVVSVLLSPVLMVLMLITVIGIPLVPFLMLALFCAGLFGKAAVLATIGRRITRFTGIGAFGHIAVATLLGGVIATLLYVIPGFGFIAFNLIGVLGLGVVIYTLLLTLRTTNASVAPAAATVATAGVASAGASEIGDTTVPPAPPQPPPVNPTNVELNSLPRAGFWIRMGALTIDALLVAILVNWLEPSGHLFLVALAGYGALMWKLKGTTIGGIVCNLRVVRTDGRDIEWETAIVRALSCFLSLIPAGLGFIWMVFDNNRQTWHDKIAGTVVVRAARNQPLV